MADRRIDVSVAAGVVGLGVIGLLDVLVLLPGELAPSTRLPAVWAEIAATGDLVPVLAGPAVWALLCIWSVVRHLRARRPVPLVRAGGIALVELGVLAALEQAAAFGMGLWLSNHLRPFEGGTTTLEDAMLVLGAISIGSGIVVLAIARHRRAEGSAAV